MECNQMRELISAYADGELDGRRRGRPSGIWAIGGMFSIAEKHFGAEGGDAE